MKVCATNAEPWRVTLVDTGDALPSAEISSSQTELERRDILFHLWRRCCRHEHSRIVDFYRMQGWLATLTGVECLDRDGVLDFDESDSAIVS